MGSSSQTFGPVGQVGAAVLKAGIIFISVNGHPADNLPTVSYFFRLRDAKENVQLVVLRGTAEQSLSVTPVAQRNEFEAVSRMADPEKSLVSQLGILGVEIDQQIAASAKGLRDPNGVIVVARAAGTSSDVPIMVGDVIRSLNKRQILTLQGLRDAVCAIAPGSPVTVQIQREGKLMYVSFTLE